MLLVQGLGGVLGQFGKKFLLAGELDHVMSGVDRVEDQGRIRLSKLRERASISP